MLPVQYCRKWSVWEVCAKQSLLTPRKSIAFVTTFLECPAYFCQYRSSLSRRDFILGTYDIGSGQGQNHDKSCIVGAEVMVSMDIMDIC